MQSYRVLVAQQYTSDAQSIDVTGDGIPDLVRTAAGALAGSHLNCWPGQADGTYTEPVTSAFVFNSGEIAHNVWPGDFDEDGKLDLAVRAGHISDTTLGGILLFKGDGTGAFTLLSRTSVGQPSLGHAVGDFNGDNHLDVAVTLKSNVLRILLGNGAGTLTAQPDLALPATPSHFSSGRFNSDNCDDLLVRAGSPTYVILGKASGPFTFDTTLATGVGSLHNLGKGSTGFTDLAFQAVGQLTIFTCDGSGGFGQSSLTGLPASTNVLRADFDRDGIPDLAVLSSGSTRVVSLYRNVEGALQLMGSTPVRAAGYVEATPSGGFGAEPQIRVADVNYDGVPDVLVSDPITGVQLLTTDGQGHADGPTELTLAGSPYRMVAGDFNRDGRQDLLACSQANGHRALVFLGDGVGGFTLSANVTISAGSQVAGMVAADVTGDGKLDACFAGASKLIVLPGDDLGGLGAETIVDTSGNARSLVAAQVNGDPALELVVGGTSQISVHAGPTLTRTILSVTNGQTLVACGDFSGDGLGDLVVSRTAGPRVLINQGAGTAFSDGPTITAPLSGPGVAVDLDGDSLLDLVAKAPNPNALRVLKGLGFGSFTDLTYVAQADVLAVSAADLNGDTRPDLIVTPTTGAVTILLNSGGGSFASAVTYGSVTSFPTVADFVTGGLLEMLTPGYLIRPRP